MKTHNKGMTLSELLCYIAVFSLLICVVSGYLIYVINASKDNKKVDFLEVLFIEDVCNNIKDYKKVYQEEIIVLSNNEEELVLVGEKTNQVYFKYQYQDRTMYNGLISKKMTFKKLVLQIEEYDNYFLITNENENYYYVIEVKK